MAAALAFHNSGSDQLDVSTGRHRERLEVIAIQGHDVISVHGEQDHGRVNNTGRRGESEPCAGGATEIMIKRPDIDRVQSIGQPGPPPRTPDPP